VLLVLVTGCATLRKVPDVVDVAVVGGGLAGLVTAHELQQLGLDAHVLEMSDRLGGRVATAEYGPGLQAEYGLEELWEKSPLVPLARELGVQLEGEGTFSSVLLDGKLHAFTQPTHDAFFNSLFDAEERAAQQRFFQHAEAIHRELEKHEALAPLSFAQWLEQERLPPRVAKWVRLTLECELGATAEEFSALSGIAELRTFLFGGERALHVVGGNARLIDAFEKSLAGHTTTRAKVLGIERHRDAKGEWNVTVRYLRDGQVKELHARRVVVAVPWLMLHLIELNPPLPQSAQLAMASLGRGQYAVVHLIIDKAAHQLWGGAAARPFPVLTDGALGTVYGVRSLSPPSQPNEVFSLLIHGNAARAFHLVPHERKKDEVVAGLDALWPGFARFVRGSAVYTYHPAAIPFWPPGRSPLDAQAQGLFEAFDGLYLAGDYLVSSHSEGAVIAAQRQAQAIARELKK
jgi:monoamine oxidase